MAVAKIDPQIAFEEQVIVDPELEADIGDYLDLVENHRDWLKVKGRIKGKIKNRPEGRHRCGAYVIEVKEMAKVFSVKGQ